MKPFSIKHVRLLAVMAVVVAGGCAPMTDGEMDISERYYLAASDGRDVNFYRVTLSAHTAYSKAEFRQGWYPADAVDAVFGNVSQDDSVARLRTEAELRKNIDDTLVALSARRAEILSKAAPLTPQEREDLADIDQRKRTLFAYPWLEYGETDSGGQTVVMEYNPERGIVTRRNGEKLVFLLSADPDAIIQDMAGFSEAQQTRLGIDYFAEVLTNSANREVFERNAILELERSRDAGISTRIEAIRKSIPTTATADELRAQLLALRALIGNLEGE